MSGREAGFEGVEYNVEQNKLNIILDALKDGIFVVDKGLRLIYVNQAVLDIFGFSRANEVLGRPCSEVFYDDDGPCGWFNDKRFLEKGPKGFSIPDSSGGVKAFELYTYPSFESGNTVCQIVEAAGDGTRGLELESQIKKLATIADSSADAMMSVDLKGRFEFWNRGAKDLLGYDREEVLGRDYHMIVPEELYEEADGMREAALQEGHVRFVTSRLRKDGTHVPVDMTLTVIKDDEGNPTGIAGSLKDLSEKRRLEEDYKNLFENATDGISLTDREGKLLLFNSRLVEITGYTEKELKEIHLLDLVHPKDREKVASYDRERLTGGDPPKVYEFRLLRKDMSMIDVEVTASTVVQNGGIVGTQGILRDITEREELEAEIRETKRHLESIFDTIQEAICVINKDLEIISFNEAFSRAVAVPRNKILGSSCYEVLHNYSDEEFQHICADSCSVLQAFEKGAPIQSVHSHDREGTRVFHATRAMPMKDIQGETYQAVYVINDITEAKRSEEALRFLAGIQDQISEIIITVDMKQRIQTLNPAGLKTFGYTEEEVVGKGIGLLIPEDHIDAALSFWETLKKEGHVEPHEKIMLTKDGNRIPMELSGVLVSGDDKLLPYVIWVARDITERKKAERLLRESEEQYHSIFNSAADAIFILDLNGGIVDANPEACRMYGYSTDDLKGMNTRRLAHPDYLHFFDEFLKGNKFEGELHFESVNIRSDGSFFNIEGKTRIFEYGGEKHLLNVIRDITERKQAEEAMQKYAQELEHSNKLMELFSDIMRHDLLNPLGVIKNVFELVEDDIASSGSDEEVLIVKRNLEKIEDLIQSASKFRQIEVSNDMNFETLDLGEIIRDVLETLQSMAVDKDISISIPEGSYAADANVFIEDVFLNLISNAVKYSPEGTDVAVEIEDGGDKWKISVADKGLGVPDEHKKSIFERFKRVEKGSVKGSGLGLAIVKKVLEFHKGSVWVEDNPGGGSIFVFTMPKKRT